MTATKNGEVYSVVEMERPDQRFQLLLFAASGDLVRIHVDGTRAEAIAALERDGFTVREAQ